LSPVAAVYDRRKLKMKRYLEIWKAQLRYSFIREMMFKTNFIMWIIVEFCWFVLQLSFVQVLYLNVSEIQGWTKWEMVLLVSTSHLIQQLFQAFIMINCTQLPELIRTGKFDFFLVQPANPQFLISTRLFEPGSLVNASLAFGLSFYALWNLKVPFSIINIISFLFLIIGGIAVHYSLLLILVTFSFWMTRAQGLVVAYYQLFQLSRQPRDVFKGFVKIFFTWVVPMLLVANVPARSLIDGPRWEQIGLFILITAGFFFLASRFFHFGIKHYGSASS
jgi:ABC-2 type transport system permease protein